MEEKTWLDEFVEGAQKYCPGFRVVAKKGSRWMRILGRLMFWLPEFMEYSTRAGRTVYLPSFDKVEIGSMGHELRHAIDGWRNTNLFVGMVYYFPQWIGIGSLVSIGAIWGGSEWLWWLVCLVCLLPIPSPGRMMIERRGYLTSLLVLDWQHGRALSLSKVDEVLDLMSGRYYYFAWPFRKMLGVWLVDNLVSESLHPSDEVTLWLREFVRSHKGV